MPHFQDGNTGAEDGVDTDDAITIGGPEHFYSRQYHLDLHSLPRNILRRIMGWRPFDRSYFALYHTLDDFESRFILFLAIVLAIAAGTPLPIIATSVFSNVINSFPPPEDELVTRLEELIGIAVAYFIVTWGWSVSWGIVGERITRRTREAIVKKALELGIADYDESQVNINDLLGEKTLIIHTGTSEKVGLLIQSVSYFIAAFIAGFVINAKLTAVLFAAVIPSMALIVVSGSAAVSKFSQRASFGVNYASQIADGAIRAVKTVQAFCIGELLAEKHHSILQRANSIMRFKSLASGLLIGGVYFIMYSASSLSYWEGSHLAGTGAGDIFAVTLLILDASFVFGQVGGFLEKFGLAATAGSEIWAFLKRPNPPCEGWLVNSDTWQESIDFDDVTFSYKTRAGLILRNVSLSFRLGTTVGIVGGSGSGKSTLVSLIMRFYDPDSGRILLNGGCVKESNLGSWRSKISLLDQEPVVFSGSIMENIASGLLNQDQMSREEIENCCKEAAQSANASFIFDLPQGMNTSVGPSSNGCLSGGQLQRVCLARALIRKPSLLVLDEPTSALDANSEKLILQSLRKVSLSGCTIIMIAHRLSTVKNCDSIVVMGQGSILEQGTHEELMERGTVYRSLIDAQKLKSTDNGEDKESLNSEESSLQADIDSKPSSLGRDLDIDEGIDSASTLCDIEIDRSDNPKNIPIYRLILRCLGLSSKEKWILVVSSLASCVSGSLIVGESIIFGNLVNIINSRSTEPDFQSRVNFFAIMFLVIALISLSSQTLSTVGFGVASQRLVTRTRDTSLRTILQQDIAWFSKPEHSSFALMAKVNTESAHLTGLSGPVIGVICSVCASIVGGIILSLIVAWKIAIVLLATVPVMVLAGFLRLRVLSISEKRQETAYNEATAIAAEACSQLRTVAAYGREPAVFHQFQKTLAKPFTKSYKFNLITNFCLALSLAITYFAYTLAYWWGAKQVRDGNYTEQKFFICLSAVLFGSQSAGQVFSLASELTRASNAAKSIFHLHDQRSSLLLDDSKSNGSEASAESDLSTEKSGPASVVFDSVSFGYSSRSRELVLKNLNFEILPGQFVGIVGPSGSGKSTLINLLLRFYDPCKGSIRFNSRDIRHRPLLKYRSHISLVSQEPDLFPGSIKFNVSLGGNSSTTQEEIEAACRQCNLHEFITSLPDGYETECYSTSNGSKLSGGEKQRIAIARALIREPELLLLDEATSALDAHSEASVEAMIDSTRSKDRTTIAVAHRLSTVRNADNIIVLDKGEIVEMGKHDDLIRLGGVYADLVRTQEVG